MISSNILISYFYNLYLSKLRKGFMQATRMYNPRLQALIYTLQFTLLAFIRGL